MILCKKRCLIGLQKGVSKTSKGLFCKSIRRLLETKRACIGFELYENSLQVLVDMGISSLAEDGKISIIKQNVMRLYWLI